MQENVAVRHKSARGTSGSLYTPYPMSALRGVILTFALTWSFIHNPEGLGFDQFYMYLYVIFLSKIILGYFTRLTKEMLKHITH